MSRSKVFIGSSREQLPVARMLRTLLHPCADATVWDEAHFALGGSVLDGLIKAAEEYDFAVFVFGQDDSVIIRGTEQPAVRDNVIFELGLFIGRIGRGRAVWLSPIGMTEQQTISDLQGIIHLTFEDPAAEPTTLAAALEQAVAGICRQIATLGPRNDRAIEEVWRRRTLCVASSHYSEARFAKDIEYIHHFFSKDEVTSARGIDSDRFSDYFQLGNEWDIVHLGLFVDKENRRLMFDAAGHRDGLSSQALESMIKGSKARLVVIITCDSLSFAAPLARFTNVIAGYQAIGAPAAISWAKIFYQALAVGAPLSEAFNRAQDVTDPGLILLAHKDVRFRAPSPPGADA